VGFLVFTKNVFSERYFWHQKR